MRCLRTSLYDGPAPASMTTVMRDRDTRDTLDGAAVSFRDNMADTGALALTEIFTVPGDVPITEATEIGVRRLGRRADRELNQAILYYWTVFKWKILTDGGTLMMDKPAPLGRDEIVVVLEQLARHPEYKDFRIISTSQSGALVVLATNGKIEED